MKYMNIIGIAMYSYIVMILADQTVKCTDIGMTPDVEKMKSRPGQWHRQYGI